MDSLGSSHCPIPFIKRTQPEGLIVLRSDQMPAQVEQLGTAA